MLDLYSPNQLTIEDHIIKIQSCFETLKQSIFNTVISIKECRDQFGEEVFEKDISERLGMSPSYLNRWVSIGNSDFIMNNQQYLPHTFSSLYFITQLEKKYNDFYGNEGSERLQRLVNRGEISSKSQQNQIKDLLKVIDDRIKRQSKKNREDNVLNFSGGTTEVSIKTTSLSECIHNGYRFRSFVIDLPNELISRWGNEGFFEEDIENEFPLHKIRTPSNDQSVQCLLIIPSKKIEVGLKIINSFGFRFRDIFVPQSNSKNLVRLSNEKVILRCERGGGHNPPSDFIKSTEIEDVTDWIDDHFDSPKCCVFGQIDKEDWVCLTK